MQWSGYQTAIYDAFEHGGESLLIEAVAGSGKTTVLVELSRIMQRAFPQQRGVFLAFNKSIAMELQSRIDARNVQAMTLHSAGWAAWRRAGGLDWTPQLDSLKTSKIMREVLSYEENKRWGETTRRLVGYAKGIGLVPQLATVNYIENYASGVSGGIPCRGLVEDTPEAWEGLMDHYSLDADECNIDCVRRVLARSIEVLRDVCDFDDMLFAPVIAGVPFDKYDVVLVDEAQDVSGIQMEMIGRMVGGEHPRCDCPPYYAKEDAPLADFCPVHGLEEYRKAAGGRVIAVGDRAQAIYGFRGAGTTSMDELQRRFGMKELPLSVSYRCPQDVVSWAQQWVPQIEWADTADFGFVGKEGTDWKGQAEIALEGISKWKGIGDFQPGDAILCRLTRPLVAAAFMLIRNRIACRVLGRDIGKGLVDLMKKAKSLQNAQLEAFDRWLEDYEHREVQRLRNKNKHAQAGLLVDRIDTIRVFMDQLGDATVPELIAEIERLFVDNGGASGMVTLATCHKAKGLQWPRVFILDASKYMPCPWARGSGWEQNQEKNLQYVAATRTMRELRYITSEDLR